MQTRKRCEKFSELEKKLFVEIYNKYRTIVENKKTDGRTLQQKKIVWNRITCEYNTSPHSGRQVTIKQLRRLWMNMKQRQREKLIKERQQRNALVIRGEPSIADSVTDSDTTDLSSALFVSVSVDHANDTDASSDLPLDIDAMKTEKGLPNHDSPPITNSCSISPNPLSVPLIDGSYNNISDEMPSTCFKTLNKNMERTKTNILQVEYYNRQRRAEELHILAKELMKEHIREAKAKADLAELILEQHHNTM
ncbi:uncharacterized protein LOC142981567 [Anticarsia gemmatalis]|uniref:uncharacterized protein LOC142981567 n=1 Tax=Anticarsia gemmatalis TaxID=129554 RepID=UPI003F763BF3